MQLAEIDGIAIAIRPALRLALIAALALVSAGCAGSGVCEGEAVAPLAVADETGTLRCEDGKYLHSDFLPGRVGEYPPEQKGSLRCYDTCRSDRDCNDPCLPHCSEQGLFNNTDWICNNTVRICRAKAENDCAVSRPL